MSIQATPMISDGRTLWPAERACGLRLFALAAWGILGLAVTGEVHLVAIGLALALMPLAWKQHAARTPVRAWLWNSLTIGMVVYAGRHYQANSLDSIVHFFVFLQVAKLFTYRSPSDVPWIVLVSLFHLVATAVLTAGLLFIPLFAVHLLLTASVLSSLSLVKGESLNKLGPTRVRPRFDLAGMSPDQTLTPLVRANSPGVGSVVGMNRWLGMVCLVILAFTMAIFPIIPRLSTQRLFDNLSQSPPSGAVSDFGEDIQFGQYQQIGLSNEVALYASPQNPEQRGDHVRLRGVAVDNFDGTRWRRSTQNSVMLGGITYSRIIHNPNAPMSNWTILLQPGKASHLFAPSFPEYLRLENNQTVLFDGASASAQLPGVPNKLFSYKVLSRLDSPEYRKDPGTTVDTMFFANRRGNRRDIGSGDDPRPSHLRKPTGNSIATVIESALPGRMGQGLGQLIPQETTRTPVDRAQRNQWREPISDWGYIRACLEVPDLLNSSQLLQLAREWTQGTQDNPYLMALAIESRLRSSFEYSLQQSSQGNFIEDFLLRTRSGHCEYFATSMAVLLRLLGVPTRVANGYYSTEWDEGSKTYIVRQKDAHAWVEVYMGDGVGWMTFDPTPPSGVSRTVTENQFVRRWRELMDTIRLRWYRNVIDFSIQDQAAVRQALFSRNGAVASLSRLLSQGGSEAWGKSLIEAIPATAMGVALILAGLVALTIALRDRIGDFWARLRLRYRARSTTVQFYAEVLELLARRGVHRTPDQTPREFAEWIRHNFSGLEDFPKLTEVYYAVRYGNHTPTAEENAATARLMVELRRWSRKRNTLGMAEAPQN